MHDHSSSYLLSRSLLHCVSISHAYENVPSWYFHYNTTHLQNPLYYLLATNAHAQTHATNFAFRRNMPNHNTSTLNHDENARPPSISVHQANVAHQKTTFQNVPETPTKPLIRLVPPYTAKPPIAIICKLSCFSQINAPNLDIENRIPSMLGRFAHKSPSACYESKYLLFPHSISVPTCPGLPENHPPYSLYVHRV